MRTKKLLNARLWVSISLASFFVLMAQPLPSLAQDQTVQLEENAKAVNQAAQTVQGEQRVAERLAQELKVPVKTLQAQREQSKLGWGEIMIANLLSQKTGVSADQIITDHKSGKGWGEIAKQYNVKLGPIVSEMKKSNQALQAEAKVEKKPERESPPPQIMPGGSERGRGPGGFGGSPGSNGSRGAVEGNKLGKDPVPGAKPPQEHFRKQIEMV